MGKEIIAVGLTILSFFQCVLSQGTYKAAVVEHAPTLYDTPRNTIKENLNRYREYVADAHNRNVQIIVFPEYGLTTAVADPEEYAIDLGSNDQIITELKSMASEYDMYLVVNLLEKTNSSSNSSIIYYNTNIVVDKSRSIIAKYRKINLYDESKLTPGNKATTFTTSFGVTFGLFTCNDILFQNPARELVEKENIADIVFPTMWFSTLPFFHSLSIQHAYSQANGVNLLAANYDEPSKGNGGSGIYAADGTIQEVYIDGSHSSKMIVADVRKRDDNRNTSCPNPRGPAARGLPGGGSLKPNITNFITKKDFKSSDYKFKDIDLTVGDIEKEICHDSICCTFNISVTEPNLTEMYKLMAYDGMSVFDDEERHVRVCSLLICKNSNLDSCGDRINGTTTFDKITITGRFPFDNETFYQPTTLTYDLLPIDSSYCGTTDDDKINVRLNLEANQDKVIAFGIFGISSASTYDFGILLLVSMIALKFIF